MLVFDLSFMHTNDTNDTNRDSSIATITRNSSSEPAGSSSPTQPSHPALGTSVGTTGSRSIPLPASHVPRTQSELQLSLDEQAAKIREVNMFYRLVNGIRERHQESEDMAGIVQTRMAKITHHPNIEQKDPTAVPLPRLDVRVPPVVHFQDGTGDGWSITGFAPGEEGISTRQQSRQHVECDTDDEDLGIFAMEL